MEPKMSLREMNLRVFNQEPLPHVFFQPRFEPWYGWQKKFGSMPDKYRAMGLRGLFDELYASMRYVHYNTGMPDPVVRNLSPQVKVHEQFTTTQRVMSRRAFRWPRRHPNRSFARRVS